MSAALTCRPFPGPDENGKNHKTDCSWRTLASKSGSDLSDHYSDILRRLRQGPGQLKSIFHPAEDREKQPALTEPKTPIRVPPSDPRLVPLSRPGTRNR